MFALKYAIKCAFDTNRLVKKLKTANRKGLRNAGYAIMNRAKKSIVDGGATRFKFRKTTKWLLSEKKKYFKALAVWKKGGRLSPRPKPEEFTRGLEKTSKPGQPPVSHIGHLKKSIAFNIDADGTSMIVGPQIHRSKKGKDVLKALEEGGTSRNAWGIPMKVSARPYMRPALEKERRKIVESWRNALNKPM